jgi:hypothetical protein
VNLDIEPISSFDHTEEILGVVEIVALFNGECYLADLQWDSDQLLASYLPALSDATVRADYEAENAAGIQAAKDAAIGLLQDLIEQRHGNLATNTPFTWDFSNELLLKKKRVIPAAGLAYLWLSLFWNINSRNSYLVMTPDKATFLSAFDTIFEAMCALVLAGRRESAVWYLGNSRSAAELLRRLGSFVDFCGSGQVKGYASLTRTQRRSNDGGVDVLAVTTANGSAGQDSEIYLLGATIQATNRLQKVIGANQKARFRGYLLQPPHAPFTGVLAVPFEYSELDAEHCAEQDCLYFSKRSFLDYLPRQDPFSRQWLRPAMREIVAKTKQFLPTVTFMS